MHAYIHACMNVVYLFKLQSDKCMHTYIHALMHTCIHTCMHVVYLFILHSYSYMQPDNYGHIP